MPSAFHRLLDELDRRAAAGSHPPSGSSPSRRRDISAIAHDVAASAGDALLRAACAFLDDGQGKAPKHYRSLGRSAYLNAALKADRKLGAIASSFDFLLSISPINTGQARDGSSPVGASGRRCSTIGR